MCFDLDLCVHIGECLRRSPEVFELQRRLDGGPEERGPEPASVTPMRNATLHPIEKSVDPRGAEPSGRVS